MYIVCLSCCAQRIKFKRCKNITTLIVYEKFKNLYKIENKSLGVFTNTFRISRTRPEKNQQNDKIVLQKQRIFEKYAQHIDDYIA